MKTTFSKNAANIFAVLRPLILFTLVIFIFNSCKKELLTAEKPASRPKTVGSVSIKTIDYHKFLSSLQMDGVGRLQQVFSNAPNANKQINTSATDILSGLVIDADSVKRLAVGDTVSYVLSLNHKGSRSAMFHNLTVQQINGVTKAFITTYKPTKEWIESRKKNRAIAFKGLIENRAVELDWNGGTLGKNDARQVQSFSCTTYAVYQEIPRSCTGVGSQQHWPGEKCQNDGRPGAPYWEVIVSLDVECSGGGDGGTGEGGGASNPPNNTTPTPPENYEPCSAFSEDGEEILIPCGGGGNTGQPLTPAQHLILQLGIPDMNQMNFLSGNSMLVIQLQSYLNANNSSLDSENFARWVVAYLTAHTSENIDFFALNFLSIPEGKDGEVDDQGYYSNSIIQQQQLPSLHTYYTNYPKKEIAGKILRLTSGEVYALVGGSLETKNKNGNPDYQNACAIRGSRALNYSGFEIPELVYDNRKKTEKGADGKNYILSATAFNRYMKDKFGVPAYALTSQEIGNDKNKIVEFLKGKTGVYTVINQYPGTAGYSGHVDFIINGNCINGANAFPKGGVEKIEIWVLN